MSGGVLAEISTSAGPGTIRGKASGITSRGSPGQFLFMDAFAVIPVGAVLVPSPRGEWVPFSKMVMDTAFAIETRQGRVIASADRLEPCESDPGLIVISGLTGLVLIANGDNVKPLVLG